MDFLVSPKTRRLGLDLYDDRKLVRPIFRIKFASTCGHSAQGADSSCDVIEKTILILSRQYRVCVEKSHVRPYALSYARRPG